MRLCIVIPGEPVAKGRPRVNTKTGSVFTPAQTKAAEDKIGWECKQQLRGVELPIADGLIGVTLAFYSTADPRKVAGRSDIDNLAKLCLDALNKIAWDDDWRVVDVHATLTRNVAPDCARTVIWIEHYPEQEAA
jgi:Holliday junction resolvase RusA-like endonuclease